MCCSDPGLQWRTSESEIHNSRQTVQNGRDLQENTIYLSLFTLIKLELRVFSEFLLVFHHCQDQPYSNITTATITANLWVLSELTQWY